MANSREVLLKLVRAAMGWESDYTLPPDIDWKEVLTLATEQGVEAIAIDGYQALKAKNPHTNLTLDSLENKPLLLEYLGRLRLVEHGNMQRLAALVELSEILQGKQIPFLLMKGFACGQYYPNPAHRPCGDIDIYPGDKFDESNEALKSAGIEDEPYYYRHSAATINGVMVENHRILCDLRGPRRQTRAFEILLEAEGKKSIIEGKDVAIGGISISGAKYPTADFNALFLPWHVSAHFAFERVTLRHLMDWTLFLIYEGKNIDVEQFQEAKQKYTYGYRKFADILTDLSIRYLKVPEQSLPSELVKDAFNFDKKLADRVFNYMFEGKPRERDEIVWKFRWNNVRRIWNERWKYKELYGLSVTVFFYHKIKGVLFEIRE